MSSLEIIFQDPHLIVINKPCGLLAVPGRGADKADCALSRLSLQFKDALLVHRLDQATSGLMVFARTQHVQRELSKSFAAQTIHKTYLAVVHGQAIPTQNWNRIETSIGPDWPNRPKQKLDPLGKPSLTLWRSLSADVETKTSVLVLRPLSGRTHQLRVHLMSSGLPIVGDTLYSSDSSDSRHEGVDPRVEASRMHLHAYQLAFTHPISAEWLEFSVRPDFLAHMPLDDLLFELSQNKEHKPISI